MKYIPMRNIRRETVDHVMVDDANCEEINRFRWRLGRYAFMSHQETGKTILMHRFIIDAKPGQQVDHINGNRLDNRKCNLRTCAPSENNRNIPKRMGSKSTSPYKGVEWRSNRNHWVAKIRIGNKKKYLGSFSTPEAAGIAFAKASKEIYGEFTHSSVLKLAQ